MLLGPPGGIVMSITMNEKQGLFTLHTKSSTYQMKADQRGTLLHLYYGGRTDDSDHSYLVQYHDGAVKIGLNPEHPTARGTLV